MTQQQISTVTTRGRHVPLIRYAAGAHAQVGTGEHAPRILSFGCSDGSECLDLVDHFPTGTVFGADINPKAIAAARTNCEGRATIVESEIGALRALGPFDAVFALSVLCRYPKSAGLDDIASVYPFAQAEAALQDLDSLVKPGGLLALYNMQYFFEDSQTSDRYAPFGELSFARNGWIEKSLPEGRRVTHVVWNFDGHEMDRETFAIWMRNPVNKERARVHMDRLTYRHDWVDPSVSNGRSTTESVWVKRG